MIKHISPGYLQGTIVAPPSKSFAQRAILAASLAYGESCLQNVGGSCDTDAVCRFAESMGARLRFDGSSCSITGNPSLDFQSEFSVSESGLLSRLLIPLMSLKDKEITLTGEGSLMTRNMRFLEDPLRSLGVEVTSNGYLPITVKGPIKPAAISLDCSESSQFLSGLLFTLPLADGDSRLNVSNLKSRPYILTTLQVLDYFGISIDHERLDDSMDIFNIRGNQSYNPSAYTIEGDWSGASAFLVAPGRKTLRGLNPASLQADMRILKPITQSGLDVQISSTDVTVSGSPVSPFVFDATDSPDLFPALAVLAARVQAGESVIVGTDRLKNKESNRALTIRQQFSLMGVEVDISEPNIMRIKGGQTVHGVRVDSCNDHRIAMALASLSLMAADGITEISSAEAVNKSYRNFWNDFATLHRNF